MPRYTINDIWQLIFNIYTKALRTIDLGVTVTARADAASPAPNVLTLGAASVNGDLKTNTSYRLISNIDAWVKLASSGTPAAVKDVDVYVPAKTEFRFNSGINVKIAAIGDGSAGKLQYVEIN